MRRLVRRGARALISWPIRSAATISAVICFMLLFNKNAPAPASVELATVRVASSSCLRLFDLSESRRLWEPASQRSPAACLGSGLPPQHAGPCLTELRRQRGRPALVAYIGDSRARILYERLCEALGVAVKRDVSHWHYQLEPNATFTERGRSLRCPRFVKMYRGQANADYEHWPCFMEAYSDTVRVLFYWAPFVDMGYPERLAAIEQDCRSGLACPDLVVMTLGIWYARESNAAPNMNTPDRLLLFRDELNRLVPVLQRLSRRTQLVYRTDEPDFTEMSMSGRKSKYNAALLTVNEVAMETFRRKVSRLQAWTSSLADTVRFQQTFCRSLAAARGPLEKKRNRLECMDSKHVGSTLRLVAAAAVVRFLCRDTERHPNAHCCVADTAHRRYHGAH